MCGELLETDFVFQLDIVVSEAVVVVVFVSVVDPFRIRDRLRPREVPGHQWQETSSFPMPRSGIALTGSSARDRRSSDRQMQLFTPGVGLSVKRQSPDWRLQFENPGRPGGAIHELPGARRGRRDAGKQECFLPLANSSFFYRSSFIEKSGALCILKIFAVFSDWENRRTYHL